MRFLSKDESDHLLKACSDYLRPIVLTALNTGMRRGEILSLTWDCVDFDLGIITVLNSKNSKPRNIPMNTILTQELTYLRLHANSKYVFSRDGEKPPKSIRTAWENALRRGRIDDFRFHDLRHTFASNLVMAGADIVTMKELLGHKTITMTMRYAHLNQEHKKKVVSYLDGHYMDTAEDLEGIKKAVSY